MPETFPQSELLEVHSDVIDRMHPILPVLGLIEQARED
jgi:hypothetical protein